MIWTVGYWGGRGRQMRGRSIKWIEEEGKGQKSWEARDEREEI